MCVSLKIDSILPGVLLKINSTSVLNKLYCTHVRTVHLYTDVDVENTAKKKPKFDMNSEEVQKIINAKSSHNWEAEEVCVWGWVGVTVFVWVWV